MLIMELLDVGFVLVYTVIVGNLLLTLVGLGLAGLDFFIVGDTLLVVGLYELWLLPLLLVESFRFLLCDLLEGLTLIKGVKYQEHLVLPSG